MSPTAGGHVDRRDSLAGADRWTWILPLLLGFSIAIPIVCTVAAAFGEQSTTVKELGGVLALAFVLWTIATRNLVHTCRDEGRAFWPLLYLGVNFILVAGMTLTNPVYFFVASLLYWQTFAYLELRWAIPAAVVLTVEMVALQVVWSEGGLLENPGAVIGGAVSILFGTILAIWIGGIIDQSSSRADLIAELEATRAALGEAHHGAGVLAERERLAHEIHDTLAQGFTSIVMLSQAAVAADNEQETTRLLSSIERTARENLAEARDLVEGAGPTVLAEGSLVGALERLADRVANDLGIHATTEVRGSARTLPSATEVALLRAAQEAVANVRRHAHASELRVVLDYGVVADDEPAPEVTVEVSDDGQGFDVAASNDGFGLAGMRTRMERVGGTIEVLSERGRGTVVKVAVP